MSNSRKFKKLALPCTSRQITQISEFFIQNKELSCSQTIEQIPPIKRKLVENEGIIILQNEDVAENGTPSESNGEQTIKLIKSFEYEKRSTKRVRPNTRSSTQCNTMSHFFNQSDNEFEIPKKQPKQVKKVQPKKTTSKSTKISKKQMKINKAFMRSEEALFSEIVAQHSIVDNIDPDELQLALTLSRSEHEAASSSCPVSDEYSYPKYVHEQSPSLENVRTKLQEFGFQVGGQKDYDLASFVRGNKKGKWASRLTPLTLRNAEKQKEKLEKKIEQLLNFQDFGNESKHMEIGHSFKLSSDFLSTIKSPNDIVKSKAELVCKEETDISDFYVSTLFKPSYTKPCALLKRFEDIPGRDFSPSRKSENKVLKKEMLNKGQVKPIDDMELERVESLTKYVQSSFSKQSLFNTSSNTHNVPVSDSAMDNNSIQRNVDELQDIFQFSAEVSKSKEMENRSTFDAGGKNCIRAPSPDLFADCEGDSFETTETKNSFIERNNEVRVITSNTENSFHGKEKSGLKNNNESNEECIEEMPLVADGSGIESFEKYTTDEDSSKNNTKYHHDLCIDLTQEDSDNAISEQYEKSSFSDKQISQNSSSSDCIILSDDEVNYSIKMAADIEDKSMIADKTDSVDLAKSSSSDHEKQTSEHNKMHEKDCSSSEEDEMYLTKQTSFSNKIRNHNNDENKNTSLAELIKDNYDLETSQSEDEVDLSGTLSENENINNITATSTHFDVASCYDLHSVTENIKKYNGMELEYNNIKSTSFIDLNNDTDDIDNDLISNNDDDDQFPISPEKLPASKLDFNWVEPKPSCFNNNLDDTDFDLEKLKAKYGIKDDVRKPSNEKNSKSSKNFRKSISENIHTHKPGPSKINLKKYSSSNKFSEFLDDDLCYSDVDEIDKPISKSPISKRQKQVKNPSNLETLLKGDITYRAKEILESPEEYVFNGKTYLIRTRNIPPKPDYANMDTPTRLRELHILGLKPLKKKQAIIMLDYIYHQTHPVISDEQNLKALRHASKNNIVQLGDDLSSDDDNLNDPPHPCKYNKFNLKDCFGDRLLAYDDELGPESNNELYIFQTNRKSKISNCFLPLHVAWFNLIKSNEKLREAILYYEPIDLQEIYIFLKKIGYRYDPKDMKKFFDQRCIIFRYDLSDGNSNRHVRKIKSSVKKY